MAPQEASTKADQKDWRPEPVKGIPASFFITSRGDPLIQEVKGIYNEENIYCFRSIGFVGNAVRRLGSGRPQKRQSRRSSDIGVR